MANRPDPGSKRRPWWTLPALSLLVLVGGNALLWSWAEHRRSTNEYHLFSERSDLVIHEVQDLLENNADALRALRGYVQAQGTPSPAQWHTYLASLNTKDRYPGIHSFQYSQRVEARSVPAFDHGAQALGRPPIWGFQGGRGVPVRPSESYFPIVLAEPPDPQILSFDAASRDDVRQLAQVPAMESSQLRLGPPFSLQQSPRLRVIPLVAPIYAGDPHPPTVEARRSLLRGYVTLLMNPDEIFGSIGDGDLLNFAIYDDDLASGAETFSQAQHFPKAMVFSRGSFDGPTPRLAHQERLMVLGRPWIVEVRGTPWWDGLGKAEVRQVVGSGIAVSLGLLAAIISLAYTRERAYALAERMTRELREANRALLDIATTDSLTGLLNRRAMEGRKAEESARAVRDGTPLSVISLDVDFFKHVNDKYGHGMGDVVLRNLGRMLRETVRLTDHAGRVGGEEFLLVCPNTDGEGAKVVAEQLRTRLERMDHQQGDVRIRVTASFGVATAPTSEGLEMDRLLRRADRALYEAKDRGRNQVVVWAAAPPRSETSS